MTKSTFYNPKKAEKEKKLKEVADFETEKRIVWKK